MRGPGRTAAFRTGLVAIVITTVVLAIAFTGFNPFSNPYRAHVVLADALYLRQNAPVRISGVDVGKVERVDRYRNSTAAVATVSIERSGLPIHRDAQIKLRPRLFFEGAYFLDVQPGTPGTPDLPDGGTIPLSQTSGPVRSEYVLGAFPADVRHSFQSFVGGFGAALSGKPSAREDATQEPALRGLTASQALNRSLLFAPAALRGLAVVSDAALGRDPGDLARLVSGQQKVSAALARNSQSLRDLVTNLNTTTAALASTQNDLRASVAELPDVLEAAGPTLSALDRAFPPARAFAREAIPGVNELGPTIDAAFPWVAQARPLVSPAELQGLLKILAPATTDLAAVQSGAIKLVPQLDLASRCAYKVVLPAGDLKIDDPPLSTGLPNYKEFWQSLVGLSGESANYDGNGPYTRFSVAGGSDLVSTGPTTFGGVPQVGNAIIPPLGSRPVRPASQPPKKSSVACYRNPLPNLAARTGAGP